jgi:hypothetical protein|nr:MAG TPA: hypothetical protein [Caudoviricetes sp.]
MAKQNKEFEWRMQGMLFAHKIVKEKGLDELTKEIKTRNMLKLDIWADKGEVEVFQKQLSQNLYTNMLATVMYTIHNMLGFGETRLKRLKEEFDRNVKNTFDLDWLGERYVRLEDYAIELNKRYNLGIDVARIAACQDLADEADARYRKLNTDIALRELENNGFRDAADFLRSKISDIGRIEHGEINRMDTRRTQSNPENGFTE